MKLGLTICDEIIGMLIQSLEKDEKIMIINGLKQRQIKDAGTCFYRQKDPSSFFRTFGIEAEMTEQNMTDDGVLIFNDEKKLNESIEILKNISIKRNNENIFFIEKLNNFKVFYKFAIASEVDQRELIVSKDKEYYFYDLIERMANRTGEHIPEGDIFHQGFEIPKKIYNHQIYDYLLSSV